MYESFFSPELLRNQICFPNLRPIITPLGIKLVRRFFISFLKLVLHSFAP